MNRHYITPLVPRIQEAQVGLNSGLFCIDLVYSDAMMVLVAITEDSADRWMTK
jgi:hypothetical protein